jgi:hypothetical protein
MAGFGIGIFELIIIGVIVLIPLAIVIGVLLASLAAGKRTRPMNPNLIPCPDCGRLVSLRAKACPQCGCPLTPESEK